MLLGQRLRDAFHSQAESCAVLGSPFTAKLMLLLSEHLPAAPHLYDRLSHWPGDVGSRGASLPLRVAGGLHFLVRAGMAPELARAYPPNGTAHLARALRGALAQNDVWLRNWVELPPQTNEVGRSAVLIAAAQWVGQKIGHPLQLSELGASAGLNLNFDRYVLAPNGLPSVSATDVLLRTRWEGDLPKSSPIEVVARRGVDLSPMDPVADRERLISYIWPDQFERLQRVSKAVQVAAESPVAVDKGDAAAWLSKRLKQPRVGTCHFVFHTIAFQYFPAKTKEKIEAAMQAAGAAATKEAPLAWFGMEADTDPNGAALTLRFWPGDQRYSLGRAGFHGQWVSWKVQSLA